MKNHPVNAASSDPEQSWARARDNLRTYRQAGRRDWGDIDEAAIARYVAGESDPAERRLVERAMRDFPRIRDCVNLLSDVTNAEVPDPVGVIEPDSRATIPHRRSRAFRLRKSWLPAGVAAAAAAVFVGLSVRFHGVTRDTSKAPTSLALSSPVARPTPAAVDPAIDSGVGRPTSPDPRPQTTSIVAQSEGRPATSAGEPRSPGEKLGPGPPPVRTHEGGPRPAGRDDAKPQDVANQDEPAENEEPEPEPEPLAITNAKVQRNVPLGKLLDAPELYSGQLVSLERTYCVRDVAVRRPEGPVRLSLIESDLTLKNNAPTPRRGKQAELDVDARLADRLVQIGKLRRYVGQFTGSPGWDDQPAIVTLKVADRPTSKGDAVGRIVGIEFLQDIKGEITGDIKKVLRVRYLTRTVTPDGETSGMGDAAEWSKTPKLGHLHQLAQRNLMRVRSQITNARAAQANRVFAEMMRQGLNKATMQGTAANAAERRERAFRPLGR